MITSMTVYKTLPTLPPKKPTAFALGYFDGVHLGHKSVLDKVLEYKEKGYTAGAFTFSLDYNTKRKSSSEMIQSVEDRLYFMKKLGIEKAFCPDFSQFMELSPEEFILGYIVKAFNVKALCCGEDFHFGKNATGGVALLSKLCKEANIELTIIPQLKLQGEAISSTRIKSAIATGQMDIISSLLGRPFSIFAPIVHGKKLGRELGFPTANQVYPVNITQPKFGVYATVVTLEDGRRFAGATNVGVKPTVEGDEVLAETYIVDFTGNLYDNYVKIEFVKFLRPEEKFSSLEELTSAIKENAEQAYRIFKEL